MGFFGNSRKKIENWAPLVMEGYVPSMPVEAGFLGSIWTGRNVGYLLRQEKIV